MAEDQNQSAALIAIGVLNIILGALGIIFYILVIIAGFEPAGDITAITNTTTELEWRGWVGLILTIGLFVSGFFLLSGFQYGSLLASVWAVCWIIWEIILIILGVIYWPWFIICGLVWPIILLIVANTIDGEDVFNQPSQN